MKDKGPKLGWILGGLGSLCWIPLLALAILLQGRWQVASIGLGMFGLGLVYLILMAPWKHPRTPLWRIYLGLIALIVVAAIFFLRFWPPQGTPALAGEEISYLWIIPLFTPVFIFGRKTWDDLHRQD